MPFAKQTYQALEQDLSIQIYNERNILRSLFNHREENDWQLRTSEPGYEQYMLDEADLGPYLDHTVQAFSYGEVQHCAQVNLPVLTKTYQKRLMEAGRYLAESFDYKKLKIASGKVQYKDHQAQGIIFCEGYNVVHNPYFNYLPYGGAKGEVLIIKVENVDFEKILKHRVFITPLGDQLYWIGASYDWNFEDDLPTSKGKSFLVDRLNDFLKVPYQIVEHKAAIRPTVKDRRPFLGKHPQLNGLFLFNGLGTKGASLGPFWANAMAEYLSTGKPLDASVNITRFA